MEDEAKPPYLNAGHGPAATTWTAGGSWTVIHASAMERLVASALAGRGRSIALDLREVQLLDTSGAWLLEKIARGGGGVATRLDVTGISDRWTGLLDQAAKLNRSVPVVSRKSRWRAIADLFVSLVTNVAGSGADFLAMLGVLVTSLGRALRHPSGFRLTSTIYQLHRVAWQAVPIMVLITFLIGAIIAQQGIFHFRRFGAESYVVDLVGILVLREIGVLIVAIMVAGRSGSAFTAEIGAMKMREEVDALVTMQRDPAEVLILPRCLALVIGVPILAFLGSLSALFGGGLIAWLYGGMSPAVYVARLREAVSITHFEVGIWKAPFMALVIGCVAAMEGLSVKGSAESLGRKTTASVVKSIFLVIVLDGLFAVFFASIGM